VRFDAEAAFATVIRLADGIGPREASSAAYRRAAALVEDEFTALGYSVSRQRVPVPAGNSWGVPVPAGVTTNVIAVPTGFDRDRPHRVVGAHLDTVPQAPGAEDNASGIGVLLELARMFAAQPADVPVMFVAFGGEEPRGPGDALHHFGSQRMVAELSRDERDAVLAMLSLDRVGVRAVAVPVCHGGRGTPAARTEVVAAARSIDVPARACENRASDHWSFEKAGIPAVRMGSVPYDGYHSPRDLPRVVDERQLDRVGRIAWAWMQTGS
jgi:Iap family predicted aminopeptidase